MNELTLIVRNYRLVEVCEDELCVVQTWEFGFHEQVNQQLT